VEFDYLRGMQEEGEQQGSASQSRELYVVPSRRSNKLPELYRFPRVTKNMVLKDKQGTMNDNICSDDNVAQAVKWSEDSPEISTSTTSDQLHIAAQALLRQIQTQEPDAYRMEIEQTNEAAYHMKVIVNPFFWFEMILPALIEEDEGEKGKAKESGEVRPDRVDIARGWIDSVRSTFRRTGLRRQYSHGQGEEIQCWPRQYCKESIICQFANDRGCNKLHSKYTCAYGTLKMNRKHEACGWYCFEELMVDPLCDKFWLVCARAGSQDFSRDLLIFPRPAPFEWDPTAERFVVGWGPDAVDMQEWKGHFNNAELATMPQFWKKLLEIEIHLKSVTGLAKVVERFALNFGLWESRLAQDSFSLECHGHAHIILTSEAQRILATASGFEAISGRPDDPPLYCLKDVEKLESLIQSYERSKHTREMMQLSREIANLSQLVREIRDTGKTSVQGHAGQASHAE